MRKIAFLTAISALSLAFGTGACAGKSSGKDLPGTVRLSDTVLRDKIKGGWAGQTFGCAYGGPTEFKFNGRMIPEDVQVPWDGESRCKWYFDHEPGIYDDVYMDLSFLAVIDRLGMDAPADEFAQSFAGATYNLWHANQAARYNILAGMKAPQCGYWTNNPHADDLDFQIEADFAGLIAPGLPATAAAVCDKVGHIMNYGDGYYGGLYVATMYSLAFVCDDLHTIVTQALKAIPAQSDYARCISDVIGWCDGNADWKDTWKLVQDRWSYEIGCPKGVDDDFDIDAKLNSAYIVMGLLYGGKDMDRTIEISMRCGADSDCNPASAAGILGTVLGYSGIPSRWTAATDEILDRDFAHTEISLAEAEEMTLRIARGNIASAGGKTSRKGVRIRTQEIPEAAFEKSFDGLRLVGKDHERYANFRKPFHYEFQGAGIVLTGKLNNVQKRCPDSYVARLRLTIDGKSEELYMPVDFATRKFDIYWNYGLESGAHSLDIVWLNPTPDANLLLDSKVIYDKSE